MTLPGLLVEGMAGRHAGDDGQPDQIVVQQARHGTSAPCRPA